MTVDDVDEADGVSTGIRAELKSLFIEELGKHPELVTKADSSTALPDPAKEPDKFAVALHNMGVTRAFELKLRILSLTQATEEPKAGKHFRTIKRGIALSIVGDTIPEKVMMIGGDGDSAVGVEIAKNADEAKEGKAALLDAAKAAITQAVDMMVTKLELPPPKDPKKPKKKK